MENPWNSLEIIKLIISALTPIIGGIIAWRLARIGKDIENKQWTDRKIIEKRLEIYEKLVPQLNDLYCFFLRIGNWKELSPPEIIVLKRQLDKGFYIYNHLFQWNILTEYNAFMDLCFETYARPGQDALIRAEYEKRKEAMQEWKEEWKDYFATEKKATKAEITAAYDRLIQIFRAELNLKKK